MCVCVLEGGGGDGVIKFEYLFGLDYFGGECFGGHLKFDYFYRF